MIYMQDNNDDDADAMLMLIKTLTVSFIRKQSELKKQ